MKPTNVQRMKLAIISTALLLLLPFVILRTPVSAAAGQDQTGAALYGQKCAGCHGKGGQGMPMWKEKGQPDFTSASFQRSRTDAQLIESITGGKGQFMPAFKNKLSADQIASLAPVIRSFGHK